MGVFFVYHHKFDAAWGSEYPLIDPARSFIPQEDFIVNIQPLRNKLVDLAAAAERGGLKVSLYFEFLNTGANVSINKELKVWPASLPKVPMAMIVMSKVEQGLWSLDKEFVLEESDKEDKRYGSLWRRPTGTRFAAEELMRLMLVESDNTAYRILLRNTVIDDHLAVVGEIGLEDMFGAGGRISAKEYSRILRALYTSSYLKRESSQYILSLMSQSIFKDYLAAPIPKDILVAHKFGQQIEHNAHLDAGIVYVPSRPYMLVVAIEGTGAEGEQERVEALMHDVSKAAYDYISAY